MEEAAAAFDSESSRMLQVRPRCHTLKCNSKPRMIFRSACSTRHAEQMQVISATLKPLTSNPKPLTFTCSGKESSSGVRA